MTAVPKTLDYCAFDILRKDDDDDNDAADDDDLVFYAPFNIVSLISRRRKNSNERVCAMKCRTVMSWIPPPAGLEPETTWSEVGSANQKKKKKKKEKKKVFPKKKSPDGWVIS